MVEDEEEAGDLAVSTAAATLLLLLVATAFDVVESGVVGLVVAVALLTWLMHIVDDLSLLV